MEMILISASGLKKETIETDSFVFVRKKIYGPQDQKHEQVPGTKGPFRVASTGNTTVVVRINRRHERLAQDIVSEGTRSGRVY